MKKKIINILVLLILVLAGIGVIYHIPVFLISGKFNSFISDPEDSWKLHELLSTVDQYGYLDYKKKDAVSFEDIQNYCTIIPEINSKFLIKLPSCQIGQYSEFLDNILITTDNIVDPDFPAGYSYSVNLKKRQNDISAFVRLTIGDETFENLKVMPKSTSDNSTIILNGGMSFEAHQEQIKSDITEMSKASTDNSLRVFQRLSPETDNRIFFVISGLKHLTSVTQNIKILDFKFNFLQTDNSIQIGEIFLSNENNNQFKITNIFNPKTHKFEYKNYDLVLYAYNYLIRMDNNELEDLNCSECKYEPVDKIYGLKSNYYPKVENLNLIGGGQLTKEAKDALSKMFDQAKKEGLNIQVVSSYRSYATQVSTFEYWVKRELNAGYKRPTAEIRANMYSARPGHSEHQLGTTVDLKAYGANSFDTSSMSKNNAVYEFIKANAHKYGFVISYPKDKTFITGYNYEPWHIRYIGIEKATQLYDLNYLDPMVPVTSSIFLELYN